MIAEGDRVPAGQDGDVEVDRSGVEVPVVVEQGVQGEEDGQVGDHSDDGGGDAGQRGGQVLVAAESFHVGGAEEDEQEARARR